MEILDTADTLEAPQNKVLYFSWLERAVHIGEITGSSPVKTTKESLSKESGENTQHRVAMAKSCIFNYAGYDTPTFASTASPLQRRYAEPAIVNGLIEMMNKY